MKYTMTIENAQAIIASTTANTAERYRAEFVIATIGTEAEEAKATITAMNAKAKAKATATLWQGDKFNWPKFIDGVSYPYINAEAEEDSKAISDKLLTVSDVFCKRATKNSTKAELPTMLFGMCSAYGHNMGVDFMADKSDVAIKSAKNALAELKLFSKFTDSAKVFFGDNATSNKAHERQLQVFFDTFYGAKEAPKAKKHYVDHLKERFIVATSDGYKDKSELGLLQLICDEAKASKAGTKYTFTTKLDGHKVPKEQ